MSLVFDIGANIGNWTNANIHKYDKIVSIEASPITFKNLLQNCTNDKVIPLNYAVCNNSGNDITFYHANCSVLSTLNKDWLTSKSSRFYNEPYISIICKTITIDNLINTYGMPDLIKIDVEGGEYDCIASLTQKVNMLCFEWASEVNNITFNCIDHLYQLGFTQYYIQYCDDPTFRPSDNDFYDVSTIKTKLMNTVEKVDWGMIWCK